MTRPGQWSTFLLMRSGYEHSVVVPASMRLVLGAKLDFVPWTDWAPHGPRFIKLSGTEGGLRALVRLCWLAAAQEPIPSLRSVASLSAQIISDRLRRISRVA